MERIGHTHQRIGASGTRVVYILLAPPAGNIFRELSQEKNFSLLVVTHDQDFADKTDRIIEMGDGRILK